MHRRRGESYARLYPEIEVDYSAPSSVENPESITEARNRLSVVKGAIEQLPTNQRDVLLMRAFDELSHLHIGQKLGYSETTAGNWHRKALAACRQAVGEPAASTT